MSCSRRMSRSIERRVVANCRLEQKRGGKHHVVPTERDLDHARRTVEDFNISVATLRHLLLCIGGSSDGHMLREDIACVAEKSVTLGHTSADCICPHIRNEAIHLHSQYRLLGTLMTGCLEMLDQEFAKMACLTRRFPDPANQEEKSEEHLETCALHHSEPSEDTARLKSLLSRVRDIPRTKLPPDECQGRIFDEMSHAMAESSGSRMARVYARLWRHTFRLRSCCRCNSGS